MIPVPSGAPVGSDAVVVTVQGVASNSDKTFTVTAPSAPYIGSLSPNTGPATTLVTIIGTNFGANPQSSTVTFDSIPTTPTSWSSTQIVAPVPAGAQTANVIVTVNGVASNGKMFTVPTGTNVYYYLDDMLGSARVITTSAGAVCYDADFYPFGGERVVTQNCLRQMSMKIEQHFRQPTPTEAEVMQRLLAADFPGKEEIAKQLAGCRVRIIDDEGSLEFEPSGAARPATVEKRIPVEADAVDEDGIHVHFLLHVVKGFAKELEVYKDDGTPIKRMPQPNQLEVIVLPA